MIGNSKPLASLSSSLLARKGQARPAMRPQGFLQMSPGTVHDDLGWNDMGEDFPDAAAAPVPYIAPVDESFEAPRPEVLRQIESLDEQLAAPLPVEPESYEIEPEAEAELEAPLGPLLKVRRAKEPEAEIAPLPEPEPVPEPAIALAPEPKPAPAPKPAPEPAIAPKPVAKRVKAPRAASAKLKAAFTLRLDHDRHLRLRLASALTRRSSQQIVAQALDEYLASLDGIDALARQVDVTDQG